MKFFKKINLFFVILSLGLLPNCGDKEQAKSEVAIDMSGANGDEILLSIEGRPAITLKQLEKFVNQAKEANQQVEMILQIMPNAMHDVFYMNMENDRLLNEWVKRNKIDQKEEYKNKREMLLHQVENVLAFEFFKEANKVGVSDSEAKDFYEKNKETTPGLLISAGGVNAQAVSFKDKAQAQEFLTKAKAKLSDFEKLAKESKLTVNNFGGLVNANSRIDDSKLKDKIIAINKFPSAELISTDSKIFWVVNAKAKEKAEYIPFDQAKEGIKNMIIEKKMNEVLEKKLDQLKKEYKFEKNVAYWEKLKKEAEAALSKAQDAAPETEVAPLQKA